MVTPMLSESLVVGHQSISRRGEFHRPDGMKDRAVIPLGARAHGTGRSPGGARALALSRSATNMGGRGSIALGTAWSNLGCARCALPLFISSSSRLHPVFIPLGRCALPRSAAEWGVMQRAVPHPHEVIPPRNVSHRTLADGSGAGSPEEVLGPAVAKEAGVTIGSQPEHGWTVVLRHRPALVIGLGGRSRHDCDD